MSKLKIWKEELSFEDRGSLWDERALEAKKISPLKELKTLPKMPGITEETKKFLQWKSLLWIIRKDHKASICKSILSRPLHYIGRLLRSYLGSYPVKEKGDFFLYGVNSLEEFKKLLSEENTFFVVGFSYCHKPLECPSGRFTDACIHDPENLVCKQCFIGKAINQLPSKFTQFVVIPTVHHIGRNIFEIIKRNPGKRVLFLITACEMTLKMFAHLGNMVGIIGVGIKLSGRICNTMQAFKLSEMGIKPGLTVVIEETQKEMMELIKIRQEAET